MLVDLLDIPEGFQVKGGKNGFVNGEYAFLYMVFRLRYRASKLSFLFPLKLYAM